MALDLDNPILRQAEAFRREYVEKRPELLEYRPLFDAIFERTRTNGEAPDLKDVFVELEWDDRTLRRKVQALREALEAIAIEEKLLYILTIEEGKAGHQTADLKRKRQTFTLLANIDLKDFYVRKWWSSIFPNNPGAERRGVCVVYPTIADGSRILASHGDLQLVKHLSRSLWLNGVECDDKEASMSDRPDEADRHLILTGNEASNPAIVKVSLPKALPLRLESDAINDGGDLSWTDGKEGPRTVHALVTTCPCKWSKARLWLFEACHDRALEAVARYFSDAEKMRLLANALGLSPVDEFPAELQLVFAISVNSENQLRGADGDITLVHTVRQAQAPTPSPRRFPAVKEEKPMAPLLSMKKRRA
jgi:hypothetical protein